ncbi:MAG: hypothetical protein KME07_11910 [Pegethrix bostrychoides GSE-TBD4-15B]|uniref:Filament integrity protein n=1 Tax=Pegethrix bostrychoides GSE-TBD4-15B TaxID=2839662 RepID=A0A951U4U0_9CYAN|nr:hypothetical protein [Pegethrix bostrychoides GSE-TBD4-15B]
MVANLWPFRAIMLQALLLTMAIAIESIVLLRQMNRSNRPQVTPRQSIQYAASMNLLSTVLGWLTLFSLFDLEDLLPPDWTRGAQTAVLNFILFNRVSDETLSFLIVLAFITFFASFAVKQAALWGLRWLLQSEFPQSVPDLSPDPERDRLAAVGIRDLRKNPRDSSALNLGTVLIANAWSYAAVSAVLLILSWQFNFS